MKVAFSAHERRWKLFSDIGWPWGGVTGRALSSLADTFHSLPATLTAVFKRKVL